MAQNDEDSLRKLNLDTFRAEDEPLESETILGSDLTDDFIIVRGIFDTGDRNALENKAEMIARVSSTLNNRKRFISAETVHVYAESAVVTSLITLREQNDTIVGHYWNTKICVRRTGEWKIRSWQVAPLPR